MQKDWECVSVRAGEEGGHLLVPEVAHAHLAEGRDLELAQLAPRDLKEALSVVAEACEQSRTAL